MYSTRQKLHVYLVLLFSFCMAFTADAQIGRLALSPLQVLKQNIAKTDITVSYSRPSAKERKIFGELVPYGQYWRTGANENTTIEFSEPVVVGSQDVAPGKYAIITLPKQESWEFLLYADTENFDVPETLIEEKIIARTTVEPQELEQHIENLSISIEAFDNYQFHLSIAWEKTKVSVPIQLTTREHMDTLISSELSGPDYVDYYLAATYEFESGKNHARGLEWINKAMEITEEINWWDYRIKSYLLLGTGNKNEAKKSALLGYDLAKKAENAFGIREFEAILKMVEE